MNQDGIKPDIFVLGGFAAIILALFLVFSLGGETPLRRSVVGFDGLAEWLSDQDVPARSFRGGYPIRRETLGLRVLPIFDTDLKSDRAEPQTEQDLIFQLDERDLDIGVLRQKVVQAPTLIILPKWRSGARLTRVAHPLLLGDVGDANRIAAQIPAGLGDLVTPTDFSERFAYQDDNGQRLEAVIYGPQVYRSEGCEAIIGRADRMLLGKCRWNNQPDIFVHVLTDPDLFSNHGLALGDNARIAADFLRKLAAGKDVLVDYSSELWLLQKRAAPPRPDRTWSDLGRYFLPPFTILWVSFLLALALIFWRSWRRFGAPTSLDDGAHAASKQAAIAAKARLLRLGANDGALVAARMDQRLSAVVADVFGPHAPPGKPQEVLCAFLDRRGESDLAVRLADATRAPAGAAGANALKRLMDCEAILNEVQREFGRT